MRQAGQPEANRTQAEKAFDRGHDAGLKSGRLAGRYDVARNAIELLQRPEAKSRLIAALTLAVMGVPVEEACQRLTTMPTDGPPDVMRRAAINCLDLTLQGLRAQHEKSAHGILEH